MCKGPILRETVYNGSLEMENGTHVTSNLFPSFLLLAVRGLYHLSLRHVGIIIEGRPPIPNASRMVGSLTWDDLTLRRKYSRVAGTLAVCSGRGGLQVEKQIAVLTPPRGDIVVEVENVGVTSKRGKKRSAHFREKTHGCQTRPRASGCMERREKIARGTSKQPRSLHCGEIGGGGSGRWGIVSYVCSQGGYVSAWQRVARRGRAHSTTRTTAVVAAATAAAVGGRDGNTAVDVATSSASALINFRLKVSRGEGKRLALSST